MNPESAAIKLLDEAIAQHDEAIKQHKRERQELVRAKLTLAQTNGNLRGQPEDLRGLRLTDAIQAVLNGNDSSMPFAALYDELIERGARLGVPSKPQRFAANLKTAVINSPAKFRYDAPTEMVSLVEIETKAKKN